MQDASPVVEWRIVCDVCGGVIPVLARTDTEARNKATAEARRAGWTVADWSASRNGPDFCARCAP